MSENPQPRYAHPRLIQRLSARSKNNQVRLTERYSTDYMGASEFEGSAFAQTLREMQGKIDTAVIEIDGRPIYAAWNRNHYDLAGVTLVLNNLYYGKFRTPEPTYFDWDRWQKYMAMSKQQTKLRAEYMTDAWFDIQNGLFWTWQKINLKDIALNIDKSVEWMNMSREQQRAKTITRPDKVVFDQVFGDLRSQLIKTGHIVPKR